MLGTIQRDQENQESIAQHDAADGEERLDGKKHDVCNEKKLERTDEGLAPTSYVCRCKRARLVDQASEAAYEAAILEMRPD